MTNSRYDVTCPIFPVSVAVLDSININSHTNQSQRQLPNDLLKDGLISTKPLLDVANVHGRIYRLFECNKKWKLGEARPVACDHRLDISSDCLISCLS